MVGWGSDWNGVNAEKERNQGMEEWGGIGRGQREVMTNVK